MQAIAKKDAVYTREQYKYKIEISSIRLQRFIHDT
jgi:hypothetical protein